MLCLVCFGVLLTMAQPARKARGWGRQLANGDVQGSSMHEPNAPCIDTLRTSNPRYLHTHLVSTHASPAIQREILEVTWTGRGGGHIGCMAARIVWNPTLALRTRPSVFAVEDQLHRGAGDRNDMRGREQSTQDFTGPYK